MSLMRWRRSPMLTRPWRRMSDVFDELDRLMSWPAELSEEAQYGPAVDVYETDDEVVVKAHMPGVNKEDLNVNIQDNALTIRAETRREEEVDEDNYFRRELRYGTWARRLPLPAEVDEEQVSAKLHDGVLEIRASKTEEVEAGGKKVEVE
ncbi:MAG: Hsp20/alpha crystallin family protein [Armatimonadota bacterium]|nr:Hsp20/alpha crystallin family protein [Armatimonadota bacterium]